MKKNINKTLNAEKKVSTRMPLSFCSRNETSASASEMNFIWALSDLGSGAREYCLIRFSMFNEGFPEEKLLPFDDISQCRHVTVGPYAMLRFGISG